VGIVCTASLDWRWFEIFLLSRPRIELRASR